jgi:PEP-CTERM motif
MRISKNVIFAGLLLTSGIATRAQAGATFAYTSYSVTGDNVTVIDPTVGINEGADAGLITLHGAGSMTMAGYCVDILDRLLGSATYNTAINAATNPNLTSGMIRTISALVAHTNSTASNDAAIQIAIWETEYGNAIRFSGDVADVTAANADLLNVTNGTWAAPSNQMLEEVTPYGASANQTLVYLVADPVPEPMSMALLGSGLFGIGMIRRRRSS